jgi:predicted outer membrane repeat protein
LTWTDPEEGDLATIQVTWTPGGDTAQSVNPGEQSFAATGLSNGTEYEFSVVAVDDAEQSSTAATITATPLPPVDAPTFSQPGGDYEGSLDVTMSVSEQAATVYYTTDGSEPTEASTEYSGPAIALGPGTTTLRARAFAPGKSPSAISEAVYKVFDVQIVTTSTYGAPGSFTAALANVQDPGIIRFDGDYTIVLPGGGTPGWEISSEVIIDGTTNAVTIGGGNGVERLFDVTIPTSVTFRNLTLEDGSPPFAGSFGGAVRVAGGASLEVDNVSFVTNTALGGGGAIYLGPGASGTIKNSSFTGGYTGERGGAIFAEGGVTLVVRDSTFEANQATSMLSNVVAGGAIAIRGTDATVRIADSTFTSNIADKWAGAISVTNGAEARIVRSDFLQNRAGLADDDTGLYGGGALNVASDSTAIIAGSYFERNEASSGLGYTTRVGGAIRNQGSLIAYGNRFNGNLAENTGAAIYSGDNAGRMWISSSSFVGNESISTPSTAAAVHAGSADNDIRHSSFADNVSTNATGAIQVPNTANIAYVYWSAFKGGSFDPDDFGVVTGVVATNTPSDPGVTDADPLYTTDPSPGADGSYDGTNDDYGDLRPDTGSPLLGGGNVTFLFQDTLDVDKDGNTSHSEPRDASGTTARVIDSIEIGAWEGAN